MAINTSKLSGYAKEYAEARNRGASDVQAHHAATQDAGGSSFTAFSGDSGGNGDGTTTYPVSQPQQQKLQQQPQQSQVDVQQYLNELKEAQRKSRIAALETARTNALTELDTYKANRAAAMDTARGKNLTNYKNALEASNTAYDTEKASIAPAYYDKRNQAAAASDVGAMNFAQYMAARGVRGAAGAMPEIYRNTALQGQIGALDRSETQDLSDIARRRTATQTAYDNNVANLETAYQSDLAALLSDYDTRKLGIQNSYDSDYAQAAADVDAASLQAYINQMNADRVYAMQQQQLAQERELADMSYQNKETDAAKQGWLDTIGQFGNDYQAEINRLQGDGDTSNDWQIAYLQAARNQKLAEQEQAAAAARQQDIENQQRWAQINKTSGGNTVTAPVPVTNPFADSDSGDNQIYGYDIGRLDNYIIKLSDRNGYAQDKNTLQAIINGTQGLEANFKRALLQRVNEQL